MESTHATNELLQVILSRSNSSIYIAERQVVVKLASSAGKRSSKRRETPKTCQSKIHLRKGKKQQHFYIQHYSHLRLKCFDCPARPGVGPHLILSLRVVPRSNIQSRLPWRSAFGRAVAYFRSPDSHTPRMHDLSIQTSSRSASAHLLSRSSQET